jgi:ribosomal protein S18 acetylase RimI-like enzyme
MVILHYPTDQEAEALQDQLVKAYRDAFGASPYCKGEAEVADFAQSLPRHMGQQGFRMVVALEGPARRVVGFAYGYENTADQWWYQEVAKAAQSWIVAQWLAGSFRLVEMAVKPEAQGRGIGGLMHDHLLTGLSYQKAVLSTMVAETNAYAMYRKRSWRVLLDDFHFPGVARPYRIMGLELTGQREKGE